MAGIQYQFTGTGTQPQNVAAGSTRWNATTNTFEMYNGQGWQTVDSGWAQKEPLADSIGHAVDQIGQYIEEDHADNVAIRDAYQEWLRATERFRVVAAMAEKNE